MPDLLTRSPGALVLLGTAISAVVVVLVAFSRLRQVRRVAGPVQVILASAVGACAGRSGLARLAAEEAAARHSEKREPDWTCELLSIASADIDDSACVALSNEILHDVAARLDTGSALPRAMARLSVALPLSGVFFGLAQRRLELPVFVAAIALALAATAICLAVGRAADQQARRARGNIDRMVGRLLHLRGIDGSLPHGARRPLSRGALEAVITPVDRDQRGV